MARQLAGAPPVLELPADRPRPAVAGHRGGARARATCRASCADGGCGASAGAQGATLFMVLLAAFQALLVALRGPGRLAGGLAGRRPRRGAELEGLIGFFVNTLVLRGDLAGEPRSASCSGGCARRRSPPSRTRTLPFEKLVEELAPERTCAHAAVPGDARAAERRLPALSSCRGCALRRSAGSSGDGQVRPRRLELGEAPRGLAGGWSSTRADLFDAATVERLARPAARRLLAGAAAEPGGAVSRAAAADRGGARGSCWARRAGAARPLGAPGTVHELFAEQARRDAGGRRRWSPRDGG